jgi:hypothetical protein
VREILERDLTSPSLDEVRAPFRDEVARLGIGDEELERLRRLGRSDYTGTRAEAADGRQKGRLWGMGW